MKEALIQVITAAIGSLGFSIYFRVREKNVIAAMAGGAIGWIVYLVLFHFTKDLFISNFAAAFIVFVWAEIMARILKAPSNTYLIPGIIPLIPGGSLYYTMKGVVDGNQQLFAESGKNTVFVTFGMAAGMVVAAVVFHYIIKIQKKGKRNEKV
ncbi:MAG: threonine/serine exporter family protein [Eubacterium sp.]|nr:threonine/serine exporter family protein [Eubacterium sp.]